LEQGEKVANQNQASCVFLENMGDMNPKKTESVLTLTPPDHLYWNMVKKVANQASYIYLNHMEA
jgi:hypothetical protein